MQNLIIISRMGIAPIIYGHGICSIPIEVGGVLRIGELGSEAVSCQPELNQWCGALLLHKLQLTHTHTHTHMHAESDIMS